MADGAACRDGSLEAEFITASTDQSAARLWSAAAAAPLAAVLLGWIALGQVSHVRVVLWVALVGLASLSDTAVIAAYRRRRRCHQVVLTRWPRDQFVTTCMLGGAWALAPVLLNAGVSQRDLQLVVFVFLTACGATTVVISTGPRRYFLAFQGPICLSLAVANLLQFDRTSVLLAAGAVLYLAVTTQLNEQVRVWSLNAIRFNLENVRLIGKLTHLSTHDPLTELPNRTLFDERICATAATGQPYALLYVDIDDFKKVNDQNGHAAGDDLLRWAAVQMSNSIRDSDFLARTAGDEFTILLTPIYAPAEACVIAERIRHTLTEVGRRPDSIDPVTVSIGIAVSSVGETPEHLLELADRALYTAKHQGKNQVAIYEPVCGVARAASWAQSATVTNSDGQIRPDHPESRHTALIL
jgi:diguanylate cyclase (GGDEF)-like protein